MTHTHHVQTSSVARGGRGDARDWPKTKVIYGENSLYSLRAAKVLLREAPATAPGYPSGPLLCLTARRVNSACGPTHN